MSGAEILKKYDNEWDRLCAGKHYYDIPVTIRRAFFTHACMAIQHDAEKFIVDYGYNELIGYLGEPICRFIHFGEEPKEF
jgi:hypothetical protein